MRPGLVKIVALQLGRALAASWWTLVAGSCLGAASALLLLHLAPQPYAEVSLAPVTPPRIPLIALGVLAGCLICVGPVLTRRYLNPVISSEAGLRSLSGVPLMARIPAIHTPRVERERRRNWIKNIGLSVLGVAVLVTALVTLL